jgi:hypothetical protein
MQPSSNLHLQVTIVPREKYPLGQTVLLVNEQRERTQLFSRRYLEEQLLTVLAGAAPFAWHTNGQHARTSVRLHP